MDNVFKSLARYDTDENGQQQLRFDPPVYQQRYSAVLNILRHNKWKSQMKKVHIVSMIYIET